MPLINKEDRKKYSRKYYYQNKDKYREKQYKRLYGISLEEYNSLLKSQQHSCAICGISQGACDKFMHVDHCHATGKIRGLLCNRCNLILGKAEDNLGLLKKCISYLENS